MPVAIINDGAEDAEAEMGSTFTLDATVVLILMVIESYCGANEGTQVEMNRLLHLQYRQKKMMMSFALSRSRLRIMMVIQL